MIDTSTIPGVEITLWGLVAFSAATWTLIVFKAVQHFRVRRGNRRYEAAFWSAQDLATAARIAGIDGSLARLGGAGFKALHEGHERAANDLEHDWDRRDLLERYLRKQIQRERRQLESGLALLASVGSTAPFVGLFGTVWGIMNALTGIGSAGNVTLEVVAGPIGEALVATGIGIGVAVPAVLAYNYFLRRLKLIVADLDDFAHDFVNLAQRTAFRVPAQNGGANRPSGAAASKGSPARADGATVPSYQAYA